MTINLFNINKFIKDLSANHINGIDLFEQYYCFEIKENIEIYNELIKKLNNDSLADITAEQEQKYKNFFLFLKEEITKTKKNIKKIINMKENKLIRFYIKINILLKIIE